MARGHGKRCTPPKPRPRDTAELRLLGLLLMAAGLVLLFLCIPGWAWAALIGAALVGFGFWLLMAGIR